MHCIEESATPHNLRPQEGERRLRAANKGGKVKRLQAFAQFPLPSRVWRAISSPIPYKDLAY
jgi:hypothetical protein